MENNKAIPIVAGMLIVLILAGIGAIFLTPAESKDNIIIINRGSNSTGGGGNVTSVVAGSGISVNQTTGNVLVTNTAQESTDCFNVGSGTFLVKNTTSHDCYVKSLVNGTGITLSNSSNTVTITNSAPDNTSCANVGSGSQVYKDGECNFRSIIGSSDISVTQQTNTITIDYNGTNSDSFALLTQNTTIGGSATNVNLVVNQNLGTHSDLSCGNSGGITACAEHVKASSVLIGQNVNKMTIGIRKVGTPTGTATIGVCDSSANLLYTFGTQDVSALTTSYQSISYTGSGSHVLALDHYVCVKSPAMVSTNQLQVSATNPNQFDGTNSVLAQYNAGWADATTWDLGSSGSNGAWKLEKVGNTYIQASFTAKKHLMITAELRMNQSDNVIPRANNDTGSNYATRTTINGATSSLVSQTHCNPLNGGVAGAGDRAMFTLWVDNNQSGDRKIINGVFGYGADTSASTAPSHVDFTCKWSNTSDQMTSIIFYGSYLSGSIITVWGYD